MAVVLPFFLALVLMMIDTARLITVGQVLTVASREGCRVAAVNGNTSDNATARVNSILTGAGVKPSDTTMTFSPAVTATTPSLGTPITLTLSVPFKSVSYLPTPFLFGSTILTASATMSSERP
jgi:Flp pilus assembly protein TadG